MSNTQYQPGLCNIGGAEVARRKQVAQFGGALYLIFSLIFIIKNYSLSLTAVIFLPAMIFAVGFIQSRRKFCLAFGLMGTFNFQRVGTLTKIEDRESLAADRRTALTILLQALGLALALTAATSLLNSII